MKYYYLKLGTKCIHLQCTLQSKIVEGLHFELYVATLDKEYLYTKACQKICHKLVGCYPNFCPNPNQIIEGLMCGKCSNQHWQSLDQHSRQKT